MPERQTENVIHYTPIELLQLPARAYNALLRANIGSIEQLKALPDYRVMNFRGIGVKNLDAIKTALNHHQSKSNE